MQITRIFDLLDNHVTTFNNEVAFAVKRNGRWDKFSSKQYKEYSDLISYGLLELGLKKGDKIATISNNRPEWNFIDMGMMQIGAIHVPVYPTISDEEFLYIFKHSESRLVIVSSEEYYQKIEQICKNISEIKYIFSFDKLDGIKNWEEIVELGKKNAHKHAATVENIKTSIQPDDLCSIIYTSGTTGKSKGVMLSHYNFLSNVKSSLEVLRVSSDFKVLSFLPLCHVLERMVNYVYQYKGVEIYYAESTNTIGENLKEICPQIFVTVPRVLEKIYNKIYTKGKELKGIKKILFFWAFNLGLRYELGRKNGWFYHLKLAVANKIIFSKWRQAVGNKIEYIVCGGAALQERLTRLFWAANIPIIEGYGLTETSPVISVSHMNYPDVKIGTVGPLLSTSQVKIADDGEILFKGPNLMLGYYKAPELTAEVIDNEGWFHTGDIGQLLERNILKITDRKKEIFKLSTGKYVAPQIIENKLKESPFIEQIMIVGENHKFVSAIISPNFEYLHDWCAIHKVYFTDNFQLIKEKQIINRFQRVIDEINKKIDQVFQIKKFALVSEDWNTDSGELSPTLKLKRKFIQEKYQHLIAQFYEGEVEIVVDEI